MPRGVEAQSGKPNCLIQRFVCPACKRKGLYTVWYKNFGAMWVCMYSNSFYYRKCDFRLTDYKNAAVMAVNPNIKNNE